MIFDNTHPQNLLHFVSHFVHHIVLHCAPHFVCILIFLEFQLSKQFVQFFHSVSLHIFCLLLCHKSQLTFLFPKQFRYLPNEIFFFVKSQHSLLDFHHFINFFLASWNLSLTFLKPGQNKKVQKFFQLHRFLNTFLQLAAEKKYSKNSAAGNFFGPSYFVMALMVFVMKKINCYLWYQSPECMEVYLGKSLEFQIENLNLLRPMWKYKWRNTPTNVQMQIE